MAAAVGLGHLVHNGRGAGMSSLGQGRTLGFSCLTFSANSFAVSLVHVFGSIPKCQSTR